MSLSFSFDTFKTQFPPGYDVDSKNKISYEMADSNYTVSEPKGSNNNTQFNTEIRWKPKDLASDDVVELTVNFTDNATVDSISYEWTKGGDPVIPKSVIALVDVTAEIAGAVGAIETLGLDELVVQEAVADFDEACEYYNKVVKAIDSMENTGGRLYLSAVVPHVLVRLAKAVTKA